MSACHSLISPIFWRRSIRTFKKTLKKGRTLLCNGCFIAIKRPGDFSAQQKWTWIPIMRSWYLISSHQMSSYQVTLSLVMSYNPCKCKLSCFIQPVCINVRGVRFFHWYKFDESRCLNSEVSDTLAWSRWLGCFFSCLHTKRYTDGIPNFFYTQRREYPSREYPTEMLGIHDLGILGMMTAIPN